MADDNKMADDKNSRREEECMKKLDEKLEMDQLLKLFTSFPMEEDLLYEALEEHQKVHFVVCSISVKSTRRCFDVDATLGLRVLTGTW